MARPKTETRPASVIVAEINQLLQTRFEHPGVFTLRRRRRIFVDGTKEDVLVGQVCDWAPREEMSLPGAEELCEALKCLWVKGIAF